MDEEAARLVIEQGLRRTGDFAALGGSVATALALMVIAIVLVSTWVGERRLGPLVAGSLGFLGLCVLPVFMMLFGAFATVQRSKSVEFCGSCHPAMDPYVDDMKDPASQTLAASHYARRYLPRHHCYGCHAEDTVWGAVDARLRGFAHLYHTLIGSETARGRAPIRVYRPYGNEICLACHGGGSVFVASGRGVHREIASNLVERDPATGAPITSCLVCHGPAHPGFPAAAGARAEAARDRR